MNSAGTAATTASAISALARMKTSSRCSTYCAVTPLVQEHAASSTPRRPLAAFQTPRVPGRRQEAGGDPRINSARLTAAITLRSLTSTPDFIPGIAPCLPARTRPAASADPALEAGWDGSSCEIYLSAKVPATQGRLFTPILLRQYSGGVHHIPP